jgi:hypothetical protein
VHGIEAFPAGRDDRRIAQPVPVDLGVGGGSLGERQPLPGAEVGLDQVVVDGDGQAEGGGGGASGFGRPLQR